MINNSSSAHLEAQRARLNKKQLSESDICDKFIRPAMVQAGWNGMDQIDRVNERRSLCADLRPRLSIAQESQSQFAQVLIEHQSTATF
jgi:type I site-specific restriction endonuclease